jgi:hypothetical protein
MTRNRKADLQRKLAMAPVAKPPAGLADRIKSDIPQHLGLETERTQLRKSAMFNLRIAASIILLVSSLYLALRLVSPSERNLSPNMAARETAAPSRVATSLPNTPPEPGSARVQERTDLPALPRVPPPSSIAATPPPARIAEARHEEAAGMSGGAPSYVGAIQDVQPATESTAIANAAPAAPPPPLPAPLAEPAPIVAAEGGSVTRDRTLAKSSAAAPAESRDAVAQPAARNFFAIQQAMSRGEAPREMDVYAIVQHFAAPERIPDDLHVELEASAMPLDASKWLLRVSVDAPGKTSAAIDLSFGDALTAHRQLTGSVAPNQTALYEIEFKPGATPGQTIATIQAGNARSSLRVADLHHWENASPRMKRASLAAAWARAPKSKTQTEAIVAKAREAHIDELAEIAEQAERIR